MRHCAIYVRSNIKSKVRQTSVGIDRLLSTDNLDYNWLDRTFTYALNGNMLSNSGIGAYAYPAAASPRPHEPTTAGPTRSYGYDANGNALTNGTQSYAWDGENRLLSVEDVDFVYGPDPSADSARLKMVSGSGTTLYLGADIELAPSGTWTNTRIPTR